MTVDTKLIRSILNGKSCPSDMNEVLLNLLDEFDLVVKELDQLRAENERLKGVLQSMFDRCLLADEQGELSELISGELLDSVGTLLGYTPENAEKENKETEKNILQFLNSLKGE